MTPTNELRFVERTYRAPYEDHWNIRIDESGNVMTKRVRTTRTLQQKWERSKVTAASLNIDQYEWRDVPLVKEEA
jgi:hypothetical protein